MLQNSSHMTSIIKKRIPDIQASTNPSWMFASSSRDIYINFFFWECSVIIPAVGYATAVAAHAEAFLQVWSKSWGSDAPAAVGTHTLFVFPLVVHLPKNVYSRLVHDFYKWQWQNDQRSCRQDLWVKGGFFQKAAYTKIVPSYTNEQEKVLALGTAHTHWLN